MTITASELKKNLGKYLDLAQKENIYVTKNGSKKIVISRSNDRPLARIDGIFADYDITDEEIKNMKSERLKNV